MAVIDFINNFRIQDAVPIDTRFVVDNEAARLGLPSGVVYEGLFTYQKDTDELYVLTNISQANHADGWTPIEGDRIQSFTNKDGVDDIGVLTLTDGQTFEITLPRGGQGIRGFQAAYPILVYRVGTIASDYTGDLTSTFDTDAAFSQDNGTPTDWLANKSGVLADGEVYWIRQAIVDPSLVTEGSTTLTLTWGTPYQEESGAGGATAGVIEYTNGSGGTLEVAQWIGTINQYNALTDGIKNSEILFTITNDQTEVAEASSGASEYGDSDVLAYLNANTYVGGITVAASAEINLLDGKVDADLTNTQLQESRHRTIGIWIH